MKIQTTKYVTTRVIYKAQRKPINRSGYRIHYLLEKTKQKATNQKHQLIMVLALKLPRDFIFKEPFIFLQPN